MKKIALTGLGIGIGSALYHYFSQGVIDWIRAIAIAAISIVLLVIFERIRKK